MVAVTFFSGKKYYDRGTFNGVEIENSREQVAKDRKNELLLSLIF